MSTALETQLADWLTKAEEKFAQDLEDVEREKADSEEEKKARRNKAEQLIVDHKEQEER